MGTMPPLRSASAATERIALPEVLAVRLGSYDRAHEHASSLSETMPTNRSSQRPVLSARLTRVNGKLYAVAKADGSRK